MEKSIHLLIRPFSETDPRIRQMLNSSSDGATAADGHLFLLTDGQVYSCKDNEEGRELIRHLQIKTAGPHAELDALSAFLKGEADLSAFGKHESCDRGRYCVILFRPLQHQNSELLRDLIPAEDTDRITVMDNGDIALVKHMNERSDEEAYEFASATAGIMESEAGIDCYAGVGKTKENLTGLPESYSEAYEAIRTGIRHKIPGRVFIYSRQTLERLADIIPAANAAAFRSEILRPGSDKLLTEEMLETIQVFFQNDLNLSTTSRQLFIHRNTLLYRMEKIRKETGLDLRKFEDAAALRMIMSLSDTED